MNLKAAPLLLTLLTGVLLFGAFLTTQGGQRARQNPPSGDHDPIVRITTLDRRSRVLAAKDLVPDGNAISKASQRKEIRLNTKVTFQPIEGFGYTLTGGSAMHLMDMSAPARRALLQELFGQGEAELGISYLRLSLAASDLDPFPWSYCDEAPGMEDVGLSCFSLSRDTLYLLPVLREILSIAPDMRFMASPWSAPVWMKNNGDSRGGSLKAEEESRYARYLLRYLQEMRKAGIRIDALTIQNEPLHPGNNPSMYMSAEQQARFVGEHLGPLLESAGFGLRASRTDTCQPVALLLYDHNCDKPEYPLSILADSQANAYSSGVAWHLYAGDISALDQISQAYPDKAHYFTEQWTGSPPNFREDFAWHIDQVMIGSLQHGARVALEWNLSSNEALEPHTDRGGCSRCLGAVQIDKDSVQRHPSYYVMAHVAPWIRADARRIASRGSEELHHVAFLRPDGRRVVLLRNRSEQEAFLDIHDEAETLHLGPLPAGAALTLLW